MIDVTRMLAGPFATTVLGDLGADVIKVESPDGDPIRHIGPYVGGQSHYHLSINRSKRSVVLDLKTESDRRLLGRMISGADVVVENFRPGVFASMGFDPVRLCAEHPRLIVCSISGFGATGPLRERRAFDLVAQAMSGVISVTGEPGRAPVRVGVPIGDMIGGFYSVIAILAALQERTLSGRGQFLDVSMLDGLVSLLANHGGRYFATGEVPEPVGSGHPTTVPYGAYAAKDGYIVVAMLTKSFWPRLCAVLDLEDLAADPELGTYDGRSRQRDRVDQAVSEALLRRTVAEWCDILEAADIPYAPILDVAGVAAHPQVRAREMVQEVEHPVYGRFTAFGNPLRLIGVQPSGSLPPPMLGEHTEEVLRELGDGVGDGAAVATPSNKPLERDPSARADLEAIRARLPGTALPEGTYTIEPWAQMLLADILDASPEPNDAAHPLFGPIAAQCGIGITVEGILELAGSSSEDGPLQSSHDIESMQPLAVGATYRVTGRILAIERKHGRKTGPFDMLTFEKSLHDDQGALVARVTDVWVLPRRSR